LCPAGKSQSLIRLAQGHHGSPQHASAGLVIRIAVKEFHDRRQARHFVENDLRGGNQFLARQRQGEAAHCADAGGSKHLSKVDALGRAGTEAYRYGAMRGRSRRKRQGPDHSLLQRIAENQIVC
jgi:hypothetical protein